MVFSNFVLVSFYDFTRKYNKEEYLEKCIKKHKETATDP
jgi:hypothetical protein